VRLEFYEAELRLSAVSNTVRLTQSPSHNDGLAARPCDLRAKRDVTYSSPGISELQVEPGSCKARVRHAALRQAAANPRWQEVPAAGPERAALASTGLLQQAVLFQRCWRLYELCRASNGPDLLIRRVSSIWYS
jgi:hypothetical protein